MCFCSMPNSGQALSIWLWMMVRGESQSTLGQNLPRGVASWRASGLNQRHTLSTDAHPRLSSIIAEFTHLLSQLSNFVWLLMLPLLFLCQGYIVVRDEGWICSQSAKSELWPLPSYDVPFESLRLICASVTRTETEPNSQEKKKMRLVKNRYVVSCYLLFT